MSDNIMPAQPQTTYITPEEYLSLEGYDRGDKFDKHYRPLDSLQEYVLIARDECYIEHRTRQVNDQWLVSKINYLQGTLELSSIQCNLAVSDIYDKVKKNLQSLPNLEGLI